MPLKRIFIFSLPLACGCLALYSFIYSPANTFRNLKNGSSCAMQATNSSCKQLLLNMLASIEEIKTLKFHLKCNERFIGKLLSTESQVKLNRSPKKIYIYLKGPEVLWIEGQNNNNALINPDGFPYMNLNINPWGNLMRENQHHTVHEMGFEYFSKVIKNFINALGNNFDTYFKCTGVFTWNTHECYMVTAEYPNFKYLDYTVQEGETLVTIARKLGLSDYMLLEINSAQVKDYDDVEPNQKIKIPNAYGSKILLYIDKNLLVPRVIKVYDDKGLFESYEYHNLQVNPAIPDEEFTRKYKGYGF